MTPKFNSGVASYIDGKTTVVNHFPVDMKGVADIRCEQCNFYRPTSKRCGLNGEICEFPAKYVGSHCPLEFGESEE